MMWFFPLQKKSKSRVIFSFKILKEMNFVFQQMWESKFLLLAPVSYKSWMVIWCSGEIVI